MFSAVIFDFDGTLVDSEWAYALTDIAFVKTLGGDSDILDHAKLVGNGVRTFVRAIAKQLDIKDRSIDELIELNDKLFIDIATDEVEIFPKMYELIKDLNHRNIPMAIASNTSTWVLEAMAHNTGVSRLIEKIYSADIVENDKPSPDLYLHAAKKLQTDPKKCLVFEDSETGVISALEAGMSVIWLDSSKNRNRSLQKSVYRYYENGHRDFNYRDILDLML